jgi:thiol-disulfide isomerase/thioredoxin
MKLYAILFLGLMHLIPVAQAEEIILPKGIIQTEPRMAPDIKLKDADGKPFEMLLNRGHWLFVHFWATWCGPCRREMPTIQDAANRLKNTSFRVVLVNTAETDDEVFAFLGIVAPNLPTLMDTDGTVTDHWQPRGLPSTYIVDPAGRIRYLALGGREWNKPEYLQFLQQLASSQVTN